MAPIGDTLPLLAPKGPRVVATGGAMHSIAQPVEDGTTRVAAPKGRREATPLPRRGSTVRTRRFPRVALRFTRGYIPRPVGAEEAAETH